MEKFCEHIEKLLAQHDYVVVPNLGGFVVQMQSAEILTDRITPPLSTIGFNSLMYHADGLLAIEIARSQKISYRTAMEYIEREVESLQSKIQPNGNIQFGNLGAFSRNKHGFLLFSPPAKAGFLPQNFELNNLYITQRYNQIKIEKPKITITLPSTRIFKYASAAILIVGLLCISPRINDMRLLNNANLVTSAFYNSTIHPVLLNTSTDKEYSSKVIITNDSDNYHVVVASLPNQSSADKFCKELVTTDFPSAHVLAPTKTFRVAIQSFSDRDKAIQFMENLRKSDRRFKTAWVLCK